jgi:hypothetical protein
MVDGEFGVEIKLAVEGIFIAINKMFYDKFILRDIDFSGIRKMIIG